jgi:hypothetical protein
VSLFELLEEGALETTMYKLFLEPGKNAIIAAVPR